MFRVRDYEVSNVHKQVVLEMKVTVCKLALLYLPRNADLWPKRSLKEV